jgi:hypothetical protein
MSEFLRTCVAFWLVMLPYCHSAYADSTLPFVQETQTGAQEGQAGAGEGQTTTDAASADPEATTTSGQSETTAAEPSDDSPSHAASQNGGRMFGVLPNYATVEGTNRVDPISPGQKFRLAKLSTFDPYTFAFVGFVAGVNRHYGDGPGGFVKQYGASFADNSIGNFMTSGVFPSLLHQDPRYYQRGHGSVHGRIAYAFSRVLITRGDSGLVQANASEIAGTGVAATVSNAYYPQSQRTASATISRWLTQIAWDGLSNELKEFWPDVRRRLHR